MPLTVIAAALLTALAVAIATWTAWTALDPDRRRVLANLNRVGAVVVPDSEPEEQ